MTIARPTFDLSTLGWKAFQDLCGTVLRSTLGQTVYGFAGGRDMGRDWAFHGTWHTAEGESLEGQFTVQCKFRDANRGLRPSDVSDELPKIRALNKSGLCDSYVLMTNLAVTSTVAATIASSVRKQGPASTLILGADQIDSYLRENPRLRALVPRVYGLGDLSEIIDSRAYAQTAKILEHPGQDLRMFVITEPYRLAIEALNTHGFVLLLGSPGVGKSMIAASLAVSAADQWQSVPMKIDSPAHVREHWNPERGGQFMWIDDAFGTTTYLPGLADDWNRILPELRAAIASGIRIVMTSRDYIWRAASRDLKLNAFEPLESSQVVVDVEKLTDDDKRQIVYNHLKFGDQPAEFRRMVKPFLLQACDAKPFLPEVARRFGNTRFTEEVIGTDWSVRSFFANPVAHLRDVIQKLPNDAQAALALAFVSRGQLELPISQSREVIRTLEAYDTSVAGASAAMLELRGSLLQVSLGDDGSERWRFRHPTIGEAFRSIVENDRRFLSIYLSGGSIYRLLTSTYCGVGAIPDSTAVPTADWETVARRLGMIEDAHFLSRRNEYLATRVSCEFLAHYVSNVHKGIVEDGDPAVTRRLAECDLLPEESRARVLTKWTEALIYDLDGRAISPDAIALVLPDERRVLLDRVQDELLADMSSQLDNLDYLYDGSETAQEWLAGPAEALRGLAGLARSEGREEMGEALDEAADYVRGLESTLFEREMREPDDDYDYGHGYRDDVVVDVFSDVDQ